MKALTAELFGTFVLVFAGTGAIVVNEVSGGQITHVGIALTFGLVVLAAGVTVALFATETKARVLEEISP